MSNNIKVFTRKSLYDYTKDLIKKDGWTEELNDVLDYIYVEPLDDYKYLKLGDYFIFENNDIKVSNMIEFWDYDDVKEYLKDNENKHNHIRKK